MMNSSPALMALMVICIYDIFNSRLSVFSSAQKLKILCLHGGGQNKNSMKAAVADIEDAFPEYEFIYVNGAYKLNDDENNKNQYLWIKEPPGGTNKPTIDPGWADESIQVLDDIVKAQGPFHGIIGFSQGAAFVPVYLSGVPNGTFQIAITFCGYLPQIHRGLVEVVKERSPFGGIAHLVWMGGNDGVISNPRTMEMAAEFTEPTIIRSRSAGHNVPGTNDSTFRQVVSWVRDNSLNPGPHSLLYLPIE